MLINILMGSGQFMWTNRCKGFCCIAEKLDQFLFKGDLSDLLLSFERNILPILGSNHFLVLLEILGENKPFRCPFKFECMWFKDPKFMDLIRK
jgi:hypothetical protein